MLFLSGTAAAVVIVVLAVVLILGTPNHIGLPQGMLAVLYLGHVVLAGESAWEALALVSLGILLVGELSQWSFDSRVAGRYDAGLHRSRAIGIAALLALGLGVILLAAAASRLPSLGDPWAIAVAAGASLALLALISTVARRRTSTAE